ncbi:poly-gamma-glutamate synthase PgsB [Pseudoalteromonas luteoviolacea]|uniref:poly-gamma-glutamate synthase PgsB n=1 Tax=Pseudoalteromonas luteoviolacea TaxID=43657 RepID=UPI001F26D48D|nr:poly-gamma-glutamate synthase PgsB [Pseudoalteromonas luteoviolacea]MCF6440183.1 poly-gamma-glutamate synthase PgsB [Pseudoalteromonas luteoviolacea]
MADKTLKRQLQDLLFADTEQFWLNLYQHKYQTLVDELADWELVKNKPEQEQASYWQLLQTIAFLRHKIESHHGNLQAIEADYKSFIERLNKAELKAERELHILKYAEQLGASRLELQKDKLAFSRWFDEGAVIARYQSKVSEIEQDLKFLIAKLGALTNRYLRSSKDDLNTAWQKLDLQPFFIHLLAHSNSLHIRHGMIRALVNQVSLIHEFSADPELDAELVAQLIELLEADNTPYLAIIDILEILIHQRPTFIRSFMWAKVAESVNDFPDKPKNNDQLFILAAMPKVLIQQRALTDSDIKLIQQLSTHPYHRVRQATIECIPSYENEFATQLLESRFRYETENAIRFTLVKQLTAARFSENGLAFKHWKRCLQGEESFEIKRIILEQSARLMLNMQLETDQPESIFKQFIDVLNLQLEQDSSTAVRRFITRTREQLNSFYIQELIVSIEDQLALGETVTISTDAAHEEIGRALSFIAQSELGFNGYQHGDQWQIHNGTLKGRRFWRIWHEFFTPSTDKRQSYSHTKAQKPSAELHVTSCSTAEISETNVPGEALYNLKEHSARPYLPLPDYLLSILSQDQLPAQAKSYTPDGILLITRPHKLIQRIRAYWQISIKFSSLDRLRKGGELEQQNYLDAIRKLGFQIEFIGYGSTHKAQFPVESGIRQLFSRTSITTALVNIGLGFKEYLYSIYQNSIGQLVFFVCAFMAYFWSRHIKVSQDIQRNRKQIPISIGGWGTRGKSGTERLKAALFSSIALKVITKTTGCEAMMIYTTSNGEQHELPLFRPFDKASIWEQSDVLAFAKSVKADVFLWECMGLTPRYVRILRRWMNDNFATITNAYPDHEDILGPTGLDVATEMSSFIGSNTQVFTAEQSMYPILNKSAEQKDSTLIQVHWGEGFQITDDIRALYPYEEHPDNIALVCKMAQYIGINKDYVFKETAERIVPDIGVLQHFEQAPIGALTQSFVNSMSANERLATIENWRRLNLFGQSQQPKIQTIALINNRNDRIARTKVFAQILIEDLTFDYIVVIGTNVDGFLAYFNQALSARITRIITNNDREDLAKLLEQFKCLVSDQMLCDKLNVLLPNTQLDCKTLQDKSRMAAFFEQHVDSGRQRRYFNHLVESWHLANDIMSIEDLQAHAKEISDHLNTLLAARTRLIENPYISADELTRKIAKLGLDGQHQLIVGMQNIKGAGLNYVYAWQKWHHLHQTCDHLLNHHISQAQFRQGLMKLAQTSRIGVIEHDYFNDFLGKLSKLPHAQNEFSQAEIAHLKERLQSKDPKSNSEEEEVKQNRVTRFVLQVVESFLDAGAAVKRKKTAQQVYKDIASQRITLEKAIAVLAALNRSQKPGWLALQQKRKRIPSSKN